MKGCPRGTMNWYQIPTKIPTNWHFSPIKVALLGLNGLNQFKFLENHNTKRKWSQQKSTVSVIWLDSIVNIIGSLTDPSLAWTWPQFLIAYLINKKSSDRLGSTSADIHLQVTDSPTDSKEEYCWSQWGSPYTNQGLGLAKWTSAIE